MFRSHRDHGWRNWIFHFARAAGCSEHGAAVAVVAILQNDERAFVLQELVHLLAELRGFFAFLGRGRRWTSWRREGVGQPRRIRRMRACLEVCVGKTTA